MFLDIKWAGLRKGACNLAFLGERVSNQSTLDREVPIHPVPYARSHWKSWTALRNSPRKKCPLILMGWKKSTLTTWTPSNRRALHLLISLQWEIYGKFRMRRWILRMEKNLTSIKLKTEMSTFLLPNHVIFSTYIHRMINRITISFNL